MLGLKIGIDFGSSSFTVFADGKGIVMCEPSVMVCDKYSGKVLAIGNSAKKMAEKLPGSMVAVYPIKDGIVIDREQSCVMLRSCINKLCYGKVFKPNILMCVPSTVTPLQKKTVFDVVMSSGAGKACFVDESLAAAIGAGVSLTEPKGTIVCDIGGGVTDCCVVTMGNIAVSESVNIGGNDLTKSIIEYVARTYKTEIGAPTAEEIKHTVGGAIIRNDEIAAVICGKSIESGLPSEIELTSTEVFEVLKPRLEEVLSCILRVLEQTPPELCGDIADTGIILTGGSARLFGLDSFIERRTKLKTVVADSPDECAAKGIGILLKDMKYLDRNGYIFKSGTEDNDDGSE
ncbi:MAG: rod shape-determining protein [Clostridia bacterium]|nr:rod shape-determining protein [Clostridia bacterium]